MQLRKKNDPLNHYNFSPQIIFPICGANACTSISLAMCARFLRMDNEKLFELFHPTNKANDENLNHATLILDSCTEAGVNLNKSCSFELFDVIRKSIKKYYIRLMRPIHLLAPVSLICLTDDVAICVDPVRDICNICQIFIRTSAK